MTPYETSHIWHPGWVSYMTPYIRLRNIRPLLPPSRGGLSSNILYFFFFLYIITERSSLVHLLLIIIFIRGCATHEKKNRNSPLHMSLYLPLI
jgi:hypothetical protein